MTAGAIPAPSLIPLRPPILGKAKGLVSTSSILIIKRVSGFFLAYWPMDHYYVGVRVTLSFSFPPLPDFLSPPPPHPPSIPAPLGGGRSILRRVWNCVAIMERRTFTSRLTGVRLIRFRPSAAGVVRPTPTSSPSRCPPAKWWSKPWRWPKTESEPVPSSPNSSKYVGANTVALWSKIEKNAAKKKSFHHFFTD